MSENYQSKTSLLLYIEYPHLSQIKSTNIPKLFSLYDRISS